MLIQTTPKIKTTLKTIFGANFNSVEVVTAETFTLTPMHNYWDEGTCHKAVVVQNGKAYAEREKFEGELFDLNANRVVALDGATLVFVCTYYGMRKYVTAYVHPSVFAAMVKQLSVSQDTLEFNERVVLYATRSLKSSYAGDGQYRLHEALRQTNITVSEWNLAVGDCIAKGYLAKNKSITVAGRNAIEGQMNWPSKS